MCGRYGLPTKISKAVENLEFYREISRLREEIQAKNEFYPGSKVPVIRRRFSKNTAELVRWGTKPDWSEKTIINARKENILTSRFWKEFFFQERCLIPASYFLEWQMSDGKKIPWRISLKEKELFFFAGMIVSLQNSRSELIESCVILTEGANSLMKDIHNYGPNRHRQPLILSEDKYESWISKSDAANLLSEEIIPVENMEVSKIYDNEVLLF